MLPAKRGAANLELGELAPDVATVERMVRDRMAYVGEPLLLYRDYCEAVGNLSRLARDARQRELEQADAGNADWLDPAQARAADRARRRLHVRGDENPAIDGLLEASKHDALTPDFEGWLRYLGKQGPIEKAMKHPRYQREGLFHEAGLEESVLVVAPRKWGKSELLKALVWHHVKAPNDTNPAAAVVVLDPGGDLARQVAHWPELSGPGRPSDRLVYVEPELVEGLSVGFNPLDGAGLDHRGRNHMAGMLAEALSTLTADLSLAMKTLVKACSTVLLATPGATLRDLQVILRDPENDARAAELYARAVAYTDDPSVQDWFLHEFSGEGYKGTRSYLRNRFNELLVSYDFAGMFAGPETVSLAAAIEARKVVLVNLAKFDNEDAVRVAGRLFVAMVGAIARRRAQNPNAARAPIYLVVDEATVLAGNELVKMLAQLRKFGLNLILAQQVLGSGFSTEDKQTLSDNTGCRFIGGRDKRIVTDMLHTGRDLRDELPAIERMHFWTEWPEKGGPHLLKVRSDLAGYAYTVSPSEWASYVARATHPEAGYYRPAMAPLPERAPAPFLETPDSSPPASSAPAPKRSTVKPATVNRVEPKPRRPRPSKATMATAFDLEPDHLQLMRELHTYRLLNYDMMRRLGSLGRDRERIGAAARYLVRRNLANCTEAPLVSRVTRLPHLYWLTPRGAATLNNLDGLSEDDAAIGASRRFGEMHEVLHRVGIVELHIAARSWCGTAGAALDGFTTDFEPGSRGRHKATAIGHAGDRLTPDAVAWVRLPGEDDQRALLFELERGGTGEALGPFFRHKLPRMRTWAAGNRVEEKLDLSSLARFLIVFASESMRSKALARWPEPEAPEWARFFIKSLPEALADFGGNWHQPGRQPRPLYLLPGK